MSNSSVDTAHQYVSSEDGLPSIKITKCELGRLDPNEVQADSSPNNLTNLAIKGIIAIKAMSAMSLAAGNIDDANKYRVCNASSNTIH